MNSWSAGEIGPKNFEGLNAIGDDVAGTVDVAHAACTKQLEYFIIADAFTRL